MVLHIDWRLKRGIASPANFALLLTFLLSFPLLLRWTGALSVAEINPQSPLHTQAFVKFCLVLTAFLWGCFSIVLAGIRCSGRISWRGVVGARWNCWQAIIGDLGTAVAAVLTMAIIGNLSNAVLGPFQQIALHSTRWLRKIPLRQSPF
jgi:hypothetical protein